MTTKVRSCIRLVLIGLTFMAYLIAAITAELFNWVPLVFAILGVALWLAAYCLPDAKTDKPIRRRPIYTDWDACYAIAINNK